MNKSETIKRLKAAGDAQTRKTYARHGVTGDSFGVRYADIYKLVKEIGIDQKLAEQLWKTDKHEARIVATMIVDPEMMTATVLDQWVKTVQNAPMADAVASLVAKSNHGRKLMEKLIKSKQEWIAACGWHLLGELCSEITAETINKAELEKYIKLIEQNIHTSQNRVRYAMNRALISIGCTGGDLEIKAIKVAKKIGKVEVDHGDTLVRLLTRLLISKRQWSIERKRRRRLLGRRNLKLLL